jgi:ribosomal protein L37AE/L43A
MKKSARKYLCPKCGEDLSNRVNAEIRKIRSGGDKVVGFISAIDTDNKPRKTSLPETLNIQCSKGEWTTFVIQ